MLRGPVKRIWAGERDRDALVEGLDEQDTLLVERVLELVGQYERGERRTPAQVLAELPEALRAALLVQDEAAFNTALAALEGDERARAEALLAELQTPAANTTAEAPSRQPDRPRPDIDQVIQNFLPLLGDIALAAHSDATARQLAEAMLPRLEEGGWRLEEAARRIWAGERDAEALTAGLDEQDSALVHRTLRLVADGPGMIFAASSLQIAHLRRQSEGATAQALASGDAEQRTNLARQLEAAAAQAEQQPGAPWQELAAHLRALVAQLREA